MKRSLGQRATWLDSAVYWLLLVGGCAVFLLMNFYTTLKEDDYFHSFIQTAQGSGDPIRSLVDVVRAWLAYMCFDARTANLVDFLFNGILVGVYAMLLYFDGLNVGDGDVAFAEIQYTHQQAGETISKADKDRCYHPVKGFVTVLCGLLPLVLICLAFALTARKATYTLQALPGWVSAFSSQEEIAAPLAYYGFCCIPSITWSG